MPIPSSRHTKTPKTRRQRKSWALRLLPLRKGDMMSRHGRPIQKHRCCLFSVASTTTYLSIPAVTQRRHYKSFTVNHTPVSFTHTTVHKTRKIICNGAMAPLSFCLQMRTMWGAWPAFEIEDDTIMKVCPLLLYHSKHQEMGKNAERDKKR
jgi:hypothetical protein